jgi:putative hydrolase of HD superfamily
VPTLDPRHDIDQVFAFVIELDRLKAVLRRVKPLGLDRYESSAEHSWQVCLLAMLLARHSAFTVDLHRVLEILLVHDIPEIDVGDQLVYSRDAATTAAAEQAAAERIFGLLPAPEGERLLARWREYEERRTPEARLAYAADRLMPMLQNVLGNGQSWRENGVPLERVRTLAAAALAEVCPDVWHRLEPRLDAFYASAVMVGTVRR